MLKLLKSKLCSFANVIGLVPDDDEKEALTKTELKRLWYRNAFSKYLVYGFYDEELGVYYNLDDTVGILFECTPLLFASEQSLGFLQNLLKAIYPEGSIIQFICYADPYVDHLLSAYIKDKNSPKIPSFIEKAYLSLVEFYKRGPFGMPVRNFRLFVSLKIPAKSVTVDRVKEISSNFEENLNASGLYAMRTEPHVLLSMLRRMLNDEFCEDIIFEWTPHTTLSKQIILAETEIKREGKTLKVGNKYFRCLSPKSLPVSINFLFANYATGSYDGVAGDGAQITSPFFVVFSIVLENQRVDIHTKANLIFTQQSFGSFIMSLQRKKEEYVWAIDEIERGEIFYPCFMNLWVYDTDKERVEKAVYKAKRIWEGLGCVMQEETFINLPLFFYSLPFGFINDKKSLMFLDRHFVLPTKAISVMLPTQTDGVGMYEPNMLFLGRKGQILGIDIFSRRNPNYNFIIVAPSGKGKSFTANYLITNTYGAGVKVRIIDVGRSYKKLCNMFKGKFIDFHPEADICINFFETIRDPDRDIPIIAHILAHMAAVYTGELPGRTTVESAVSILVSTVRALYQMKGNETTLDDVYDYLANFTKYFDDYDLICSEEKPYCEEDFGLAATHLAFNLRKYTSFGAYGKWFVGKNTFDIKQDDFVVLELEHLKGLKDLFEVIVLVILHAVMQDLYLSKREKPTLILLDEAWQFLQDTKAFQELVEEGYRRARKYYGSFGVITQSILDFEQFGRVGQVILSNSSFKFFLESSDFHKAREKKLLPIDDDFVFNLMTTVKYNAPKYSELFMISERFGYSVLRLTVDPYSYYVYTSDPYEVAEIEELVHSGMSYEEAINYMVEKNKKE